MNFYFKILYLKSLLISWNISLHSVEAKFSQRFTIQVQDGFSTAQNIANKHRKIIHFRPLPVYFWFTSGYQISGLNTQFRGELFYRMVLERTPYPDLFILSVPKSRSRRSTTSKPRTAILKRLESEFKIQEVEAQEILSRQKRDFINPKAKRNRYLSDDQDSR